MRPPDTATDDLPQLLATAIALRDKLDAEATRYRTRGRKVSLAEWAWYQEERARLEALRFRVLLLNDRKREAAWQQERATMQAEIERLREAQQDLFTPRYRQN
jgi:hypothetical protein